MIYTTTSIQEVLARIVRNTKLQDSSYLEDANEWIPEAMGYMKTKVALQPKWKDITVKFHKARIPCGLNTLKAVLYRNCRLNYYNGGFPVADKKITEPETSVFPGIPLQGTTTFGTHLVKRPAIDNSVDVEFQITDLQAVMQMSFHGEHWYFTEPDYINTSMADARIRVFYMSMPVDESGMPLIPDEENYKEALYYYVRAKMIGSGYEDKQFNEETCMQRFEKYAERALSRIRYPSVDQQEAKIHNLSRLILPQDYWSTFFNPGRENLL